MNNYQYIGSAPTSQKLAVGDHVRINGTLFEVKAVKGQNIYCNALIEIPKDIPAPARFGLRVLAAIGGVKIHG